MNNFADSRWYDEGAIAFDKGLPEDACPYPPCGGRTTERIAWFDGYFDKRTGKHLAHAFRHFGIQWP